MNRKDNWLQMLGDRDQIMLTLVAITILLIAAWELMVKISDMLPTRWANFWKCCYMAGGVGLYALIFAYSQTDVVVTTTGLLIFLLCTATAAIGSGIIAYFKTEGGKT